MMFKNEGTTVWLMSANVVLFWLAVIVDWASYLIGTLVGTVGAVICYYLTTSAPAISTSYTWDAVAQFLGSFLLMAFLTKSKQNIEEEKLKAMRALSATMAHELRTPLATIRLSGKMVRRHFPALEAGYAFAKSQNAPIKLLQQWEYNDLKHAVAAVEGEAQYSNTIIDMLLENIKEGGLVTDGFELHSIKACVAEAVDRYPFQPGERELITISTASPDFLFKGDRIAMINIVFNLLRNALYFIAFEQKGKIELWCETDKTHNTLCIKDTGKGISENNLSKLFDRFFTTTRHGTGLGLAYCKMVMQGFGGDIICLSELGKFTLFKMVFPVS